MTIYQPAIHRRHGPRYLAIVQAIAQDIEDGVLRPGQRLPTQRDLAERLGLSVGTVTRGYAEAERRGLVSGEVGRGTFVRGGGVAGWADPAVSAAVDLSLGLPWTLPDDEETRLLAATLTEIAADMPADLLVYNPETAPARQRAAAAGWLRGRGVPATEGSVIVTPGAQHALSVVLGYVLRPGDTLLTGALTYPGIKSVAQRAAVRLRGVALDAHGLVPADLERACREGACAVYVVPTAQNPTGATMPDERRAQVAAIAARHDLIIIEDDVHGLLDPQRRTTLAELAPDRVIHLNTLSKAVVFGLRTAFVHAPASMLPDITAGVRGTAWMPPPLMTEVALRWLADGTAARIARLKRTETEARQAMVSEILGEGVQAEPFSLHAWLRLPEPWRSDEFVDQLARADVRLAGAQTFAVGRTPAPHAVRLCVGLPATRGELRGALETIAWQLDHRPAPAVIV